MTLEEVRLLPKHEQPEINHEEELRARALVPIKRMMEMSTGVS